MRIDSRPTLVHGIVSAELVETAYVSSQLMSQTAGSEGINFVFGETNPRSMDLLAYSSRVADRSVWLGTYQAAISAHCCLRE